MYYQAFYIGNIIFYIFLGISFLFLLQKIIYHIIGLFPQKKLPKAKKEHKYAILIPARNESKVIEGLLKSIKEQTYNHDLLETYIIVEDPNDKTCEIAKKYKNTNIFVRQHLDRKTKGYALDEVVDYIFKSGKKYDAYFVFDADNILDKDFITEMNKCYDAGYHIAQGYRNSKNWNGNWVATGSALTFTMLNVFSNKARTHLNQNISVFGTGIYVASEVLEKAGGWKFFELTEDIELSMFATINNFRTMYNEKAVFFDEHPTSAKVSWNQRIRWVKGFGTVHKKYRKRLLKGMFCDKTGKLGKYEYVMSIVPMVLILATVICYGIFSLVLGIIGSGMNDPLSTTAYINFALSFGGLYLFFFLYSALLLAVEHSHSNITFWRGLECCIMFPIYMACYIPLVITALFKKNVTWKPIAHSVNVDTKVNNN